MIFENSSRELSLVEQKKLQWAKERDEMQRMGELFSHSRTKYEKTSIRTFYSNLDLPNGQHFDQNSTSYDPQPDSGPYQHFQERPPQKFYLQNPPSTRQIRSPSLPPISRPQRFPQIPTNELDTGYNSENSPSHLTPEIWIKDENADSKAIHSRQNHNMNQQIILNHSSNNQDINVNDLQRFPECAQDQQLKLIREAAEKDLPSKPLGTPSSSSSGHSFSTMSQSFQDGGYPSTRRKWDRNGALGSVCDSMTRSLDSRSSRNVPIWLEKGMSEIRDSEDESVRSFIRGQNTPIDPNTLAERASRRRKAMELQTAIKEQLLERERIKKWEKEKRLREERLEEERLLQQIEAERQRFEYERKIQEEKLENERKRQELMRLALEKAENEARLEKEKRKKAALQPSEVIKHEPIQLKREEEPEPEPPAIPIKEHINSTPPEESIEKVLIGTPIKLTKRIPNNSAAPQKNSTAQEESPVVEKPVKTQNLIVTENHAPKQQLVINHQPTDIDGIALVLSNNPVVPLALNNDFLGLNQSVNNLQFAILLAQQQQQLNRQAQLNNVSSASSVISIQSDSPSERERVQTQRSSTKPNQEKSNSEEKDIKECIYCSKFHGQRSNSGSEKEFKQDIKKETHLNRNLEQDKREELKIQLVEEVKEEKESSSEVEESPAFEVIEPIPEEIKTPKLPSDGTFIKDLIIEPKIEVATNTDVSEIVEKSFSEQRVRILTPRKYRNTQIVALLGNKADVGVQTDLQLLQNCNICVHQHLVLKEISQVTTSVTQTSRRNKKELSPINLRKSEDDDSTTTTTVTTTTTIRAKSKDNSKGKSFCKKEPRPLWGVNRPAVQFVKASERDPFCLRNRRKKSQQKPFIIAETEHREHQKVDSGISDISFESEDNKERREEGLKNEVTRNIGTEILPIKTDGNGKIFLNFDEASSVIREDYQRSAQVNNRGRIFNLRSEDLPIIPKLFHTEKILNKSKSTDQMEVSKWEKEEFNALKRGNTTEEKC